MNPLRVLRPSFIRYRWHFLGGLLFVSLSTIAGTYQGVIVRKGTNDILAAIDAASSPDTWIFVRHGLVLIGLALLSGFFMFMMRQTIIVMSRHIEYDQKNQVYRHYQELDAGFYKTHSTGDLMNRISEDVSRVRMYTGPAIMYLANTVVTTVTILIFMLSVNPRLTLLVFIPLPVLSLIIYKVSDLISRQSTRVQEQLSAITAQAQESFSAIRVVKAYARESYFSGQMEEKNETYRSRALRLATTEALFAPVMALMVGLSVLITVWYGGKLTISGEIEPGNITEFIFYVFRLTWPFASLGWVTSLIQRASASQQRLNEFLEIKPGIVNTNHSIYPIRGTIEFRDVGFVYPENGVEALRGISFHLPSGGTLGITGQVGSGKSTILQLLTRQYDATKGEILVDGRDIRQHNLHLLRKNTGVVPQESFLFSDTIANNIAFGTHQQDLSPGKIEEAARRASVYENIQQFPEKFKTVVGERGVTLSGGQKQRIAIARAFAANPPILLLDDCLSAVDSETESAILNELHRTSSSSTRVIVSHRLSSIQTCDQILFLENGRIVEQGNHESLMRLKQRYYKLFELQKH